MLRHVVMYKLKEQNKGRETELVNRFLSMNGQIPCLINAQSGLDVIGSPRSFDVVLICDFLNLDDLNTYLSHPFHQKVREFVRDLTEVAHSVDYNI